MRMPLSPLFLFSIPQSPGWCQAMSTPPPVVPHRPVSRHQGWSTAWVLAHSTVKDSSPWSHLILLSTWNISISTLTNPPQINPIVKLIMWISIISSSPLSLRGESFRFPYDAAPVACSALFFDWSSRWSDIGVPIKVSRKHTSPKTNWTLIRFTFNHLPLPLVPWTPAPA